MQITTLYLPNCFCKCIWDGHISQNGEDLDAVLHKVGNTNIKAKHILVSYIKLYDLQLSVYRYVFSDGTISSLAHVLCNRVHSKFCKRGGCYCSRSRSYRPSGFWHEGGEWWNVDCFFMYTKKKGPNDVMSEEQGSQVIGSPLSIRFHEVSS